MTTQVLAEMKNEEDGLSVVVAEIEGGFSVALRDDDSGFYVGSCVVLPTREAADKLAAQIARGKGGLPCTSIPLKV